MVNPNLDRSVTIARLIEDRDDAKETGEEEFRRWASQHLNIEIGLALMSDRWAGADFWEAAVDGGLDGLASVVERSEVLVAGIDGGGLDDLLGLAVVGREKATRRWLVWTHAWCHPRVLEIRKAEASRLEDLSRAGDLTIIVNLGEDIDELADILEGIDQTGKLARVGLDPVGVGAVVDALAERDIGGETDATGEERVVGVSQGYKLTGAIKTAERKLADGTLVHAGQPLMAWCVGNAKVELKGNAVIVTKQASGTAKIDPLMATFDAVTLMSMNPDAPVDLGELIDQGIAVL
jgi:phage terminase large subunit-like protein